LRAAQLAAAQKATRPAKPEELAWAHLVEQWRGDARGLQLDRADFEEARAARRAAARTPFDRARLADAAEKIEKAAFTRADLVEIVGAQLPVDSERAPRELVEAAVDEVGVRFTAPRAAHQREGHERFTLDAILAEEAACPIWSMRAMCAPSCGPPTSTPRSCQGTRSAPWTTSPAHPGWFNR
jgi:hypothetical protein